MIKAVAVCVFAKPPREGQVKTRLAAQIGAPAAANLARAFLHDTWALVNSLPGIQPILAVTETTPDMVRLAGGAPLWAQPPGDLGEKLEGIAAQALSAGYRAVIEIGADIPGLPVSHLQEITTALDQHDAVLGRTADGGFYALGLSRVPKDLLKGIVWSQPTTADETHDRLQGNGYHVAAAPPWFDVDDIQDLRRLQTMILVNEVHAPYTAEAMAKLKGVS